MRAPVTPRFDEDPAEPGVLADASEARLVDVDAGGARVNGLRLTDVIVERGNLANVAAPELALSRVTFSGTRLTGVAWTRGRITDVVFRDCRIDLATFGGTTFERVVFDGCLLMHTDFRDALFKAVRLSHCDLTEGDLQGLRVQDCELRSCTLDALAGVARLRGAAMPPGDIIGNAGLFASALGIRVLDE